MHLYAGRFDADARARPLWRASGHVEWHSGPWMAGYAAEHVGGYSERVEPWGVFKHDFEPFDRRVDAALYHDIVLPLRFGVFSV